MKDNIVPDNRYQIYDSEDQMLVKAITSNFNVGKWKDRGLAEKITLLIDTILALIDKEFEYGQGYPHHILNEYRLRYMSMSIALMLQAHADVADHEEFLDRKGKHRGSHGWKRTPVTEKGGEKK